MKSPQSESMDNSTMCSSSAVPFPSLPNTFLATLGIHKESPLSVEAFHEKELERKFIALSLAFQTDCTTLCQRLDLHKRQRDMAEKNVERELQSIRDHLNQLKACDVSQIQTHLDAVERAASRVSARSETYGAVQQEERVSKAFQVLVLHVEHLKRSFDKEHKELEESKRMLTDTRIFRKDVTTDVLSDDQEKYSKTFGLPVGSVKSVGRRRASVADFQSFPGFSPNFNGRKSVTPLSVDLSRLVIPTTRILASTTDPEANLSVCSKSFGFKEERNNWTRKLSSVSDEKELSEDEFEPPKHEVRVLKQEQFMLREFLKLKNNQRSFRNCYESDFSNATDSVDEILEVILHSNILRHAQNSFVGKCFYIPVMQEIWQQNSPFTLFRYFCSTVLAFIAFIFVFSIILPHNNRI